MEKYLDADRNSSYKSSEEKKYTNIKENFDEQPKEEKIVAIDYDRDVRVSEGAGIFSTPIIESDKLYFGSYDKNLYCISKYDGSLLWKFTTGGPVSSSPFLYDSKIFFGSDDTFIYCISAKDGSLVWKVKTGGRVISSPAILDGVVYCGSNDRKLYAIDAESGSNIWSFETGNVIISSPAVVGDYVYFGSYDTNFYCVERHEKTLKWKFRTYSHIGSTPLITDNNGNEISRPISTRLHSLKNLEEGLVHFGSLDNRHYALSIDGDLLWNFKTNHFVATCPTVYKNTIYFGSYDKYFYALKASSGDFVWRCLTNGGIESSPIIKNDTIFFGSVDGFIYALRLDGFMEWKFMTNHTVGCSPIINNDIIFIGSFDGYLYSLTLDGELIWKFRTGYEFGPPKFSDKINELITPTTKKFIPIWKPETIKSDPIKIGQKDTYGGFGGDNSMVSYGSAFVAKSYIGQPHYKQRRGAYDK